MQHHPNQVYEEIEDDDYQRQTDSKNQHSTQQGYLYQHQKTVNQSDILSHQQQKQHYEQYQSNEDNNTKEEKISIQQSTTTKDQKYHQGPVLTTFFYEQQNQQSQSIKISINRTQKRGSIVSYHYVYIIEGQDNKGSFSRARRFNQFFQMRSAIVSRWPGCFVPSIPAKNALAKNDPAIIKKRTRYLDDFVKKMAKLPHLYYGEEFQTLLRSEENDISEVFSKWPSPTTQSIINKYRVNFSALAGKQLNYDTQEKISQFSQLIKRNQSQLVKERQTIKNLAESYDKLIGSYGGLFSMVLPNYQKECYSHYCYNNEKDMLYLNESEVKLQEHQTIVRQATSSNPYWALYDMIRHQQRDALAFGEVFETRTKYEQKKLSTQSKILQYEKSLSDFSIGKKPLLSFANKQTPEQLKHKLQQQLQELKKQKQNILIIIDIMSAIISYIEIQRYKIQKKLTYTKAIGKIGLQQLNTVQNLWQVWSGLQSSSSNKLQEWKKNKNEQIECQNI